MNYFNKFYRKGLFLILIRVFDKVDDMKEDKIFKVKCPHCNVELWIDSVGKKVIKFERIRTKDSKSLDELIFKEKERIQEFDRKFEASFELQKAKKEEIEKKLKSQFQKVVSEIGDDEEVK